MDASANHENTAGEDETDAIIRHKQTRDRFQEAHPGILEELLQLIRAENLKPEEEALFSGELQNTSFLHEGFETCKSVGKIILQNGHLSACGTGVMVSKRLLLTSLHTFKGGNKGVVRFGEIESISPNFHSRVTTFELEPQTFFFPCPELDTAFIAVAEKDREGYLLSEIGFCKQVNTQASPGQHVNIIQYPGGGYQKMILRQNQILHFDEKYIKFHEKSFIENHRHRVPTKNSGCLPRRKKPKYEYNLPMFQHNGDTDHGSSGAPCFDDSWSLIGIHHSAIPVTDKRDSTGKSYIANEGVKIDPIIRSWEEEIQTNTSYNPDIHGELFGGNQLGLPS